MPHPFRCYSRNDFRRYSPDVNPGPPLGFIRLCFLGFNRTFQNRLTVFANIPVFELYLRDNQLCQVPKMGVSELVFSESALIFSFCKNWGTALIQRKSTLK